MGPLRGKQLRRWRGCRGGRSSRGGPVRSSGSRWGRRRTRRVGSLPIALGRVGPVDRSGAQSLSPRKAYRPAKAFPLAGPATSVERSVVLDRRRVRQAAGTTGSEYLYRRACIRRGLPVLGEPGHLETTCIPRGCFLKSDCLPAILESPRFGGRFSLVMPVQG